MYQMTKFLLHILQRCLLSWKLVDDEYDDYIEKVRIAMMLEEILGDCGVNNDYIVDAEMTILNTVGDVYGFVVYRINSGLEGGEKMATKDLTPEELDQNIAEAIKEVYGGICIETIEVIKITKTIIDWLKTNLGINATHDEVMEHLLRKAISAYQQIQSNITTKP